MVFVEPVGLGAHAQTSCAGAGVETEVTRQVVPAAQSDGLQHVSTQRMPPAAPAVVWQSPERHSALAAQMSPAALLAVFSDAGRRAFSAATQ